MQSVYEDPCIAWNKEAKSTVKQIQDHIQKGLCSSVSAHAFVHMIEENIMFSCTTKVTKQVISDMIVKFQSAVHGDELFPYFQQMLAEIGITTVNEQVADVIFWLLTEALLQHSLKQITSQMMNLSQEAINESMTEIELQTLRYVAGYIVKKLKRNISGEHSSILERLVEEHNDCSTEINDFLAYTRKQVEMHDRGGLIHVNDKFFVLLCGFEKCVKPLLQRDTPELAKNITKHLQESHQLSIIWDQIVQDEFDDNDKCGLYGKLIEYYVTLRAKSYANAHKFILDKATSAKQRKSLRHDLS